MHIPKGLLLSIRAITSIMSIKATFSLSEDSSRPVCVTSRATRINI